MTAFQPVELLGIGVATVFASICWGSSVSVRALLVVSMGVAILDMIRPLWQLRVRCKHTEKDELLQRHPLHNVNAAFAVACAAMSTAFAVFSRQVASSVSFPFLLASLAAFLCSCTVKALDIPGYPWNCLLPGAILSYCFRCFFPAEHSQTISEHNVNDCPYSADFWGDLGSLAKDDDEEEELADDLGDTLKMMTDMGDKFAFVKEFMNEDQDQEEVSTEADKEDDEEEDEEDETDEEKDASHPYDLVDGRDEEEVYDVLEKLTIAYNLFESNRISRKEYLCIEVATIVVVLRWWQHSLWLFTGGSLGIQEWCGVAVSSAKGLRFFIGCGSGASTDAVKSTQSS